MLAVRFPVLSVFDIAQNDGDPLPECVERISDLLDRSTRPRCCCTKPGTPSCTATWRPGECQTHRGRCEVEAESVAYVVAGLLGLDTANLSVGTSPAGPTAAGDGSCRRT